MVTYFLRTSSTSAGRSPNSFGLDSSAQSISRMPFGGVSGSDFAIGAVLTGSAFAVLAPFNLAIFSSATLAAASWLPPVGTAGVIWRPLGVNSSFMRAHSSGMYNPPKSGYACLIASAVAHLPNMRRGIFLQNGALLKSSGQYSLQYASATVGSATPFFHTATLAHSGALVFSLMGPYSGKDTLPNSAL